MKTKITSLLSLVGILVASCSPAEETDATSSSTQPAKAADVHSVAGLQPADNALAFMKSVLSGADGLEVSGSSSAFLGYDELGNQVLLDTDAAGRQHIVYSLTGQSPLKISSARIKLATYKNNESFSSLSMKFTSGEDSVTNTCYFRSDLQSLNSDNLIVAECALENSIEARRLLLYVTPAVSSVINGFENKEVGGFTIKSIELF